eukprot:7686911-Alexandrium_andersonii.AAC.1
MRPRSPRSDFRAGSAQHSAAQCSAVQHRCACIALHCAALHSLWHHITNSGVQSGLGVSGVCIN